MNAIQGISTKVLELLTFYGLKVVAAIIVFVVGCRASRIASNIIKEVMARSDVDATIVSLCGESHMLRPAYLCSVSGPRATWH